MRYREFKTVLTENTAQYRQMLAGMVDNDLIEPDRAANVIRQLKNTLRRNDRIVWYLRWFRIAETHNTVRSILNEPRFEHRETEMRQLFRRIARVDFDQVKNSDVSYFRLRWQSDDTLEHVGNSLETESVGEFTWQVDTPPREMLDHITALEREAARQNAQWVSAEEGDRVLIDYGDQAWIQLDRGACEREGDAMGHCGNVPSEKPGDRILSFRTRRGSQQRPHLTFILHQDGMLGEMKGRANQKPAEKYHPYIIDLLKSDLVKGILGGGYQPENNFELSDLDPDTREALIRDKPGLGSLRDLYQSKDRKYDSELGERLQALLGDTILYFNTDQGIVYLDEYDNIADIASDMGDRTLGDLAEFDVFGGIRHFEVGGDGDAVDADTVSDIWTRLDPKTRRGIIRLLVINDEHDEDDDIVDTIVNLDPDNPVYSAMRSGIFHGLSVGSENEMYKDVIDHLDEYGIEQVSEGFRKKWVLSVSASAILDHVYYNNKSDSEFVEDFDDEIGEIIDYQTISEPQYGWDGWDEDVAVDHVGNELEEYLEDSRTGVAGQSA